MPNTTAVNMQDFSKLGQVNVEGTMKAVTEWQKSLQAIATEMTNYSKRSFEDGSQTLEKLMSVKSLDQAFEIQSNFGVLTNGQLTVLTNDCAIAGNVFLS